MLIPRWYQSEAVDSLFNYFYKHSTGNPVVAMPTGTGKSLVIALFLQRIFNMAPYQRVIMLTHVKELIEQNAEELMKLWPTAPLGIYSAGLKSRDIVLPIIFGGIASVIKCPQVFGHRDLILIDEAHMLGPKETSMYQQAIAVLKIINPYIRVIGFSATPFRLKQGMITDGGIFTDVCYDLTDVESFNRLIYEGYMCPLIAKRSDKGIEIDASRVKLNTASGDFNQKDAEEAAEQVTYKALEEACERGYDRVSWLAFGSGINHCEHIASILRSFGVTACAVHSELSIKENRYRIDAFKNMEFRCLVNMNKLTTGFNHKPIDYIIDLQLTCSPGKHVQKAGRGTRPSPETGKRNCLFGDYAGNTARNGPINDPRIPNKPGTRAGDCPVRICSCGAYNHAAARFCIACGKEFEFETKIFTTAREDEILKVTSAPQIEYFNVNKVLYNLHIKKNKEGVQLSAPSMRVTYICGLRQFNEWVFLEHPGIMGKRARDWWRNRINEDPPATTYEALKRCSRLKEPKRIRVVMNTEFPQVDGYEY